MGLRFEDKIKRVSDSQENFDSFQKVSEVTNPDLERGLVA